MTIRETLTETIGAFGYRWASSAAAERWERRIMRRLFCATEGLTAWPASRELITETIADALGDARDRGDIVGVVFLELGPKGLRLVLPSGHGHDPR